MEEFNRWRFLPDNKSILGNESSAENFSIFYQNHCVGKGFVEMLADIAYELYELQICFDGFLEDLDEGTV